MSRACWQGGTGVRPSFTVLGWAAIAGFVGLVGGFIVAINRDGSYIGNANFAAWKVGTLCARIGWAVTGIIGLVAIRRARPASRGEVRVLGIGAVLSVVASIAVTHWYFAPDTWGEAVGVLALILRHRQMRLILRAAQALETRV